MSEKYLPLFRKYRPQSFKDVVGQESLVKALSNAIELNRIANAYLFAGPRGTGKTSSARIFAKSLNCVNGPTLEPCQNCPSCLDITNASGLDVIEIDAATNRGIDDAKDLIAQTQYAPMNGKYKIFIIDEVHMLSNEAFNALLKTFEEPPANVIFILATTEPHKVIETIVSRCQRFDLRRITTDDITKRLREISDIENIKITDDALYTIAKNVSGGLRDSLALLDQVSILGAREEITKADIENLLGKVTFDVSFDFLNKIVAKNVEAVLSSLDEIYNKGLEPKNFCENFIEFLRNLIFALKSTDDKHTLKFTNFNQDDINKIKSQNFDSARIFSYLEKVIEYYKEIRFTTNPYLWCELMVINLCKDNTAPVSGTLYQQNITAAPSNVIPNPDLSSAIKKPTDLIRKSSEQPTNIKNPGLANISNYQSNLQPVNMPQTGQNTVPTSTQAPNTNAYGIVENATSFVREALSDVNIPEEQVIKDSPDDGGPENSREYKEAMYENTDTKASLVKQSTENPDSASINKNAETKSQNTEDISGDISTNTAHRETARVNTPAQAPTAQIAKAPEQTQAPQPSGNASSANIIDPIQAWASVLNSIQSIPAKFFYSGVGKLVSVENNKVTLGFVNNNAINQAKSESKFKHLTKAVTETLGPDFTTEFILITNDVKVLDAKLTAKIQDNKPKPSYNQQPQSEPQDTYSYNAFPEDNLLPHTANEQTPAYPKQTTPEKIKAPAPENKNNTTNNNGNKIAAASYGQKTKEMLEAFNGRVIE